MAGTAILPARAKTGRPAALAVISALFLSGGAAAQNQSRDQERGEARPERSARDAAAARPDAETPPPPAHVRVLTEQEKRCRAARSCSMQGPCAPCDR